MNYKPIAIVAACIFALAAGVGLSSGKWFEGIFYAAGAVLFAGFGLGKIKVGGGDAR